MTMRSIDGEDDFQRVTEDGRGFILNLREDVKKLHRASCEYMKRRADSRWYPKVWFDAFEVAHQHCLERFGPAVDTAALERRAKEKEQLAMRCLARGDRDYSFRLVLEAKQARDEIAAGWSTCGVCKPRSPSAL